MMPLFRAPTDHKYFSSDYYRVDPEYGTNNDLRELVQDAHKRDMKVIIDFYGESHLGKASLVSCVHACLYPV